MWKKIGYSFLALYIIGLIAIAFIFKNINSIPSDIDPALQAKWKTIQTKIQENPQDLYAKFDLAVLCAYTNKLEKSSLLLNEINTIDKHFAEKALAFYQKQTNTWENNLKLAFLNYVINNKNSRQKTLRFLERAIALNPDNPWLHAYYGYATAAFNEDYLTAIKHVKKANRLNEDVAVFHFLLSEGYSKIGNIKLANLEKEQAVKLKLTGR